jgi:two-component system, chemotaxis family, sensor kinase CheA
MADDPDSEFLQRLRATFRLEADEHLNAMSALLLQMEGADGALPPTLLESLFREAHSLKGAARAVNMDRIESVCQSLESVLAELKQRPPAPPASGFFDELYRALDMVRKLLDSADGNGSDGGRMTLAAADTARALEAQRHALQVTEFAPLVARAAAPVPAPVPLPAVPQNALGGGTIRIATDKLDALMVQAEEMLAFKFGSEHLAQDLRALRDELESWRRGCEKTGRDARAARRAVQRTAAPAGRRGVSLERWLDAAERQASFAKELASRFSRIELALRRERRALGGMVGNLLEDMKNALMQPFSALLEPFPRLVRDLAQQGGKKVELITDGASLEIDRRILEQIKDPLIHLLRNAVDHGIETPDVRLRQGKPARGRIRIAIAARDGNRIALTIEDDGGGIDLQQVKDSAVKLGVIAADAAQGLSERDALLLIFASGLSTSQMLSDISGRGLGLAIVREKIERLGGSVSVQRGAAGGTCFHLLLPTSLATFRGLLVRLGQAQFVLPSRNVERVARVAPAAVKMVGSRDTVEFDGAVVALAWLADVLGVAGAAAAARDTSLTVVLVAEGAERIAFVVDQVIGDQEVLAKGLGPQLARVPNIAGATLLGAGLVVPILNVPDLLKSAQRRAAPQSQVPPSVPARRRRVLVVEDSITSRSLLQHVLQSAGYDVHTAVDGIEALDALREHSFDLVMSDVEMPRMDGFALTARLRADSRTAELPVVLLTSLDSREHKERGVEAGADAYIVKSAFDRDGLLDVIRRLL